MVQIPGLPAHLATIPPAPLSSDDPDAERKRADWRRWRYAVQVYRTQRRLDLKQNPDLIPFERQLCATHPAYWAAMWLRVFEPRWRVDPTVPLPRLTEIGEDEDDPDAEIDRAQVARFALPDVPLISTHNFRTPRDRGEGYDPALEPIFGYVPFICFADQVEVINRLLWSLHQTDENADILWSKCRGWGASWLGCLISTWGWTFSHHWPGAPPWNVLMLSRKEELVDSKQQRSLFWKVRRLMRDYPSWMMPEGWNPDIHDQKGILINPENGNELGGESTTTKAGRGDRVTFAWVDELSAMPNADDTWATLSETTDHRWGCYTESLDEGSFTYDNGIGRKGSEGVETFPFLVESDWYQNPLNDTEWFERQKKRYASKPEAFAREILRNPFEGVSTWVYPWAQDKAVDDTRKPVMGYGAYVTIDPGYRDPTALIAIQETPMDEFVVLDSYAIAGKEADYFVPILKPDLFEASDPHWRDKDYIVWKPTRFQFSEDGAHDPVEVETGELYEYDRRAIGFACTVAAMGKPTFIGDTYGAATTGATKDSVYSRWRKHGIRVNVDRKEGEAVTRTVKMGRTFLGRREALNERASKIVFAGTPGARMAHKALKANKFKPPSDRPVQTEPKEPLHDWTSHYVSALEFFAVYIKTRRAVLSRDLAKPTKTRLGGAVNNFGAMRNSVSRTKLGGGTQWTA